MLSYREPSLETNFGSSSVNTCSSQPSVAFFKNLEFERLHLFSVVALDKSNLWLELLNKFDREKKGTKFIFDRKK